MKEKPRLRTTRRILRALFEAIDQAYAMSPASWRALARSMAVSARDRGPFGAENLLQSAVAFEESSWSMWDHTPVETALDVIVKQYPNAVAPVHWVGLDKGAAKRMEGQFWSSKSSVQSALALAYLHAPPTFTDPAHAVDLGLDFWLDRDEPKADTGKKREQVETWIGEQNRIGREPEYTEALRILFEQYFSLTLPPTHMGAWQAQFRCLLQDAPNDLLQAIVDRLWDTVDDKDGYRKPTSRRAKIFAIAMNTGLNQETFFSLLGNQQSGLFTVGPGIQVEPVLEEPNPDPKQTKSKVRTEELLKALIETGVVLRRTPNNKWKTFIECWLLIGQNVLKLDRLGLYAPVSLDLQYCEDGYTYELQLQKPTRAGTKPNSPLRELDTNFLSTGEIPVTFQDDTDVDFCATYSPFHRFGPRWGISLNADSICDRTKRLIEKHPQLAPCESILAACLIFVDFQHEYCHYLVEDTISAMEAAYGRSIYAVDAHYRDQIKALEEAACEGYAYIKCSKTGGRNALVNDWLHAFRGEVRRAWKDMPEEYRAAHAAVETGSRDHVWYQLIKAYAEQSGVGDKGEELRVHALRHSKQADAILEADDVPLWLCHKDPAKQAWLVEHIGDLRTVALGRWLPRDSRNRREADT